MTRPGLTVPDKTYTIAEDVTRVERAADVRADLARFGAVGHSATLQTVTRLQANTRDTYGVVRPRGTAIVQRADFNTLDNSFAQSSVATEVAGTPAAGLHFVAFAPSSDLFNRARRAMDGSLGDGSTLPIDPRAREQGFNAFIHATHRQNFLAPPRAHRSFPRRGTPPGAVNPVVAADNRPLLVPRERAGTMPTPIAGTDPRATPNARAWCLSPSRVLRPT